ncbi:MAG TPA: hypothetical protein VII22_23780 [Streptosporangiaceae bacterium]
MGDDPCSAPGCDGLARPPGAGQPGAGQPGAGQPGAGLRGHAGLPGGQVPGLDAASFVRTVTLR